MAHYSLRSWQTQQLLRDAEADPYALAPGQFTSPYPGVVDYYAVVDLAQSPEARRASSVFTIDPLAVARNGRAEIAAEGAGLCFQIITAGAVWLPAVSGAEDWREYWLELDRVGTNYRGHERDLQTVAQYYVAETDADAFATSGTTRYRLAPHTSGVTLSRPTALHQLRLSWATPAGRIALPQMVYAAAISYDGATATLTVGAGHGVAVGDRLVALSGFLREDFPHGAEVTGPAMPGATLEVASARPAGASETADVVVGSRWVRVPLRFRSLVSQTTNFTAP